MNITELYEWATKNGVEDYEIEIQSRDGGGYYHGTDTLHEEDIEIDRTNFALIL